jgi:hypothetical protein
LDAVVVTGCRTSCGLDDYDNPICHGGGIANSGDLTIQGSRIIENYGSSLTFYGSADGGGIYNDAAVGSLFGGHLFREPSLLDNHNDGGGVYNRGYLEVVDSTFEQNHALTMSAIYNDAGATARLRRSTFPTIPLRAGETQPSGIAGQ